MSEKTEEKKQGQEPKNKSPMQMQKVVKMGWNEKRCKKFAGRFDTLEEWAKGHQSSFKAAVAHGWVESCSSHMEDTNLPENLKSYKPSA